LDVNVGSVRSQLACTTRNNTIAMTGTYAFFKYRNNLSI
jgi:hypothetical protein